jgi:caffeoyl-CoA O-methyltransferase
MANPTVTSPESKGFGQGDPKLSDWAEALYQPEDEVLREIRERSVREGLPPIAVGRFDGLHLEVLARAATAKVAVEIGTLGGYSGVCLLRGLAPGGVLHTFEYSPKHAEVARESFSKAGFKDRVKIYVGPALEKLREIESSGPFDLVFIDADKVSYPGYLDWAATHLRVGGMVLGDNAFGWGGVADEPYKGDSPDSIKALREFNQKLARSGRFRATMIPTAEGLAMGVKVR